MSAPVPAFVHQHGQAPPDHDHRVKTISRLFESSLLDAKDRLDASWEKAHEELCAATQGVSEADAQLRLLEQASVSKQKRDMFVVGLLYTILVDASQAPRAWADLAAIGQADHTVLVRNVGYLAQDKFPRLRASCQTQLLWLIDQMLESRIPDMHDVFVCALRQLSSNTATNKTRTGLLRQLLKIMSAHSQFLAGRRETVQACVYVLLRLMVEHHCIEALHPLRDAEAELANFFIHREFSACTAIGRDFVRALRDVAASPVFASLWSAIYTRPHSLAPDFKDIASVLFTRSSRRVIAMRIPPLVEAHLMFILTHLHTCEATKHVRWFTERHVGGEWAEPLVADLIRFICCNYHPSNKVLASPIVKRFEVVLQLLMSCSTNAGGQNAKLALFFDLLVFERGDNIMNIEPGILLLRHTSRNHPAVWATLIDFLVLIAAHLHPPIAQRVRRSVALGFNTALELGVIASMRDVLPRSSDGRLLAAFESAFPDAAPAAAAERRAQESALLLAREVLEEEDRPSSKEKTATTTDVDSKGIMRKRAAANSSQPSKRPAIAAPHSVHRVGGSDDDGDGGDDDDYNDDDADDSGGDVTPPPMSPIGGGDDRGDRGTGDGVGADMDKSASRRRIRAYVNDDNGVCADDRIRAGASVAGGSRKMKRWWEESHDASSVASGNANARGDDGDGDGGGDGDFNGAAVSTSSASAATALATTEPLTNTTLVAVEEHPALEDDEDAYDPASAGRVRFSSGRLMFFDGLIEQFGMSKTRSFSQLFDRIMTRLEEVAGKPGKESDAAFCASLAGALLPAVLVCLDDFGHSSADAIRETPLYMWPQLPEFPLPPASHHVLIARALDAQASQQTKFAALAQQLLSQLTAREPRMSLHVLLVALRDRSSRQRPQDSTAMRTYMRLHDKTNMRQLVEPVLRDISTAAADLPPLVDPLLLHAVHALGVACVSCNPVLLHALCARLSVRGWSALCHALSCIALPKLLVGDDQRDNDSDAQQPVASSYPAMPPPSAPVRLQRRVRRLWQTVIAAMALAGTAATTSTTDSASPPREYEADSGDGAALSATASHANASPNQHNHQQHHHSRRRWGIAASAAVRHRLMEVMDLELCMVDPAFSLEVVRQAPPAAAVHFHSAIARILTRLGPTAATLRLVIALQSSCAHVTASVVGVWAQQQAGQLFEAARTLLTHVEADVVREEKQRKDGDGGGDGDETGKVDASGGSPSPSWLWLNELNAFCKETTRGSNIISLVRGTLVKDLAVRETLVAIFTAAPPSWRTDFAALLSLSGIHTSSSSTTSTTQ